MTVDRDDRAFILDQESWPVWPFLPLKVSGQNRCAFLYGPAFDPDGSPVTLLVGNMFDPGRAQTREYPDLDALLADGWVVD